MEHLKRNKLLAIVSVVVLLLSFFLSLLPASAHPLFYDDNNNPVDFKWGNLSNQKANLQIAYYNINTILLNNIPDAIDAWNGIANKVVTSQSNTANSNVDIVIASKEGWNDLTENDRYDYSAVTVFSTSAGENILDRTDALSASSRTMTYAIVYVDPSLTDWYGDFELKFTLVHELGHVLGLGHSNTGPNAISDASVMRSVRNIPSYYVPQTHDIEDIQNKY